ncbi:MAG: N-acetylmuramic acid 6-phosphate etherase [Pyrinomonadaceae bacterium]|nr:N-acetylmuramic acid 6-phosphate etherase [Pyrinomonadaceae bacterium]MDQ3133562.1 N-acetylmuramic acid 6-phosphate etherase [Acidobacteriota bacterium]
MKQETNYLPVTEQENPRTAEIASLPALGIVRLMNSEDAGVASAVEQVLPTVARAVEEIVTRLRAGGRLFYVGTGTSGRLGVLDAAECPPTFGVAPETVQGVIAGGYEACYKAVEASEDDGEAGALDLEARGVNERDAVVGIAASGRTPYTIGAVKYARHSGAFTAGVTCVPDSELTRVAEIAITPVVGPEVIAGSTRLKAGTAQKLVLNMISTATMIGLGYVSGNRMTNLLPRNQKLLARSLRILGAETGLDETAARAALNAAGGDLRIALVMNKTNATRDEATQALTQAHHAVPRAVANILAARVAS